jgi:hypothetical protein
MFIRKKFPGLILLTGISIGLVGCGGSGSSGGDGDGEQIPANRFSGTYVNPVDQGSFSFTVTAPKSGNIAARSTLSAEVRSVTYGNLTVPGSYNPEINDLRFDSPDDSDPFVQILGSFDGSVLLGITSADLGSGPAVAIPDEGDTAIVYCGTFTRISDPIGGGFNLVIVNNQAIAAVFDDLDHSEAIFSGSVTGATINLSDGDGTNAVGTIAGMSVSGTWSSDDPDSGNWTGSTAACP